MTCAEFQELVGAFALDALDSGERAAAQAHLLEPKHEGCREALQRARAVAGRLSAALDQPRVPERVWERIERELRPRKQRRWSTSAGWAAAAAMAVVALVLLQQRNRLQREAAEREMRAQAAASSASSSQELARQCAAQLDAARTGSAAAREAIALLEQRGSRVVQFSPAGAATGSAFAVVGAGDKRAILVSTTLVPTAQRDYQLWVVPGGKGAAPVPAGLIGASSAGVAVAEFDPRTLAAGAGALAVSAEPKGGSPTGKPTEVVLLASLGG